METKENANTFVNYSSSCNVFGLRWTGEIIVLEKTHDFLSTYVGRTQWNKNIEFFSDQSTTLSAKQDIYAGYF